MLHLLNYTFRAKVWNFLCHPDAAVVFIETRDESSATVAFSAYSLIDNIFLFKEISIADGWWCSMVAASGDVLLIHQFDDGRNPDPSALLAFDFRGQKILWKADRARFESIGKQEVRLWSKEQILTLDLITGHETKTITELKDLPPATVYPLVYSTDSEHYNTLAAFIRSKKSHEPEGHVEYLEIQDRLIMAYYTKGPEGLANYLLVMDKSGEEELFETLGRNFVALGWNSFFVYQSYLVFVRNKLEINIYQLS